MYKRMEREVMRAKVVGTKNKPLNDLRLVDERVSRVTAVNEP